MYRLLLTTLVATLACAPGVAHGAIAKNPWPPMSGAGHLFVHYGEEHWNDDDGLTLLPKIVEESRRYRPALVTMSGDKDNDGTVDQLTRWRTIMGAYDRSNVPYFPGVGNHDRLSPPGVPPGTGGLFNSSIQGSNANYRSVFAGRPYPFGDAAPYKDRNFAQRSRPGNDPAGASTHYFVDYGKVRWIFLDNSCWGLSDCDSSQNPPFPDAQGNTTQLGYLERTAKEARSKGMTAFAVMHMPTRDPRDQSYIDPTTFNHIQGKGINPSQAPDNGKLEEVAQRSGIDGLFFGHIKGQFLYRGQGGIPYVHRRRGRRRAVHRGSGGHRPRLLARLPADPGRRRADHHRHGPDLHQERDPARGPGHAEHGAPGPVRGVRHASPCSTTRRRCPTWSCAIQTQGHPRATPASAPSFAAAAGSSCPCCCWCSGGWR